MLDGRPEQLRVEHLQEPLGIGTSRPRLSWWLPPGAAVQLAYEIAVEGGWRSGRVESAASVLVPWDGPALRSGQQVSWRVKVWTDVGESDWSAPAQFELGLLEPSDWSAEWIAPDEVKLAPAGERGAWRLRGSFTVSTLGPARLYATAHGIYEAFLNAERLGDAELTPGFTEYRTRLQVQTYDATSALRVGENTLELLVSDGWFRGQVGLPRAHEQWGTQLAALAELRVGGAVACVTGADWECSPSQIVRADLIAGQTTDFSAGPQDWRPVTLPQIGLETLTQSPAPSVRAVEQITPVAVTHVAGGQLFDLGQNINGWVRLHDTGPAGTRLTLTHGEALDADGDLTTAHLDIDLPFLSAPLPAGQVDQVISAGDGRTFEPRHTTHGFRYVRVQGHPDTLNAEDLTGVVVHTDMRRTGWFECSDERLNRLHEAALWSLRGNVCEIPTDCPTRERAGWTGDWQVFVPTAAFLYDVAGFSAKWLLDLAAEQTDDGMVANLAPSPPHESPAGPLGAMNGSAGWGDAAVIVPWEIYRAYADTSLLERQWPSMVAWLDYVERSAAGKRHPEREARHPQPGDHERYLWDTGFHWGEWLEPGADLKGPDEFAAFRVADKSDVATAYFARSAELMGQIATVLGRAQDAARYSELAAQARRAWCTEFIDADGRLHPDTQANHVRALAFGLVPPELQAGAVARLAQLVRENDTHLQTGFLATPYLLGVLADHGELGLAYELLLADAPPSWLYMIDRGATTMWERWDGIREDGTPYESLNHYSKGAVISFLHRHVAGIQLVDSEPAYRRFRLAPRPGGGLTSASARLDTPYGTIATSWLQVGDGSFRLSLTVPPGTVAEVVMPDGREFKALPGEHEWI